MPHQFNLSDRVAKSLSTEAIPVSISRPPLSFRRRGLVVALALASVAGTVHAADTAVKLSTVKITGDTIDSSADSTGSYTTPATSSATGLTLSARDTPQSVSVVTQQQIEDRSLNSVAEVMRQTIGISVKTRDRARNFISARGFDVTNYAIDGVPFTSDQNGGEEMDLESANTVIYDRIEIVRGATGLVSGAGDPSASINLIRKHANSRELTGSVELETGSWDRRGGTVDVSTPINADGSVRARVVGDYSDVDSFVDYENTKDSVFYAVLDADLGEQTSLSIGASYEKTERDGLTWSGLPYFFADGGKTDWNRSKTMANKWNEWDTEESSLFATLDHHLANEWVLSANASYYEHREYLNAPNIYGSIDRDTGQGLFGDPYKYTGNPEQYQFSLAASGPFKAWGRTHEATFRVLHNEKVRGGWTQSIDPQLELQPLGEVNFYDWDGSYPEQLWGSSKNTRRYKTTQTAFQAAVRLQLTDMLKAIVGGRITDWKHEESAIAAQEDMGIYGVDADVIHYDNEFVPYLGLIYDLSNELSAYVSYSSIFKPQTATDRNRKVLDALEGNTYELGLKGEFFDGALQTSATLFAVRQDNYAAEDTSVNPDDYGGMFPSKAVSGIESNGYELEVTGALTKNWDITAGWTKFSVDGPNGVEVATEHPRKMLRLFTTYALQGSLQGLRVGGGLSWQDDPEFHSQNQATGLYEKVDEGSSTKVDLMAAYEFDKNWSAQLNASNVFDKLHKSVDPYGAYTLDEPANVQLSAKYKF